jgi:two-component system, cell cycle response regulator DivK
MVTQRLVLIADDQEDNRIIFSAILRHHGHSVFEAVNGQEAVEQARRHSPDLILMDIQMPVLSGWEATRLLKSVEATASIPVLAVTAADESPARLEETGFCAYVRKPVTPQHVARAVEMCLTEDVPAGRWIDLPDFGAEPEGVR